MTITARTITWKENVRLHGNDRDGDGVDDDDEVDDDDDDEDVENGDVSK